ncbi:hypothetical protein [Paraburkholderia sprentiae]|uniref:Uncharacterized protein n=1 Tax=Paraburkholderia sprentiae WSM5005 TaxID=754502 RepID=A0A1I9YUB4_9BURK|nr:hypothetical protein [Paraburkholderia sprentiae]
MASQCGTWYTDETATPPSDQIEKPDPLAGTNNWYTQDGYSGGSYSNCSDASQPGVGPIRQYLESLPYDPKPNCASTHYYLLNNYNLGYNGDGAVLDRCASGGRPSPWALSQRVALFYFYFLPSFGIVGNPPQITTHAPCNEQT